MVELGQLEAQHAEFAKRNVRIVAASLDSLEDSQRTQQKFPHLVILSDKDRELSRAAEVIGPHHAPDGSDADAPTTFLIDRNGIVRGRVFRPERYINRRPGDELLEALDTNLHR